MRCAWPIKQATAPFPITIYYAFKQSESAGGHGNCQHRMGNLLDAVIAPDFAISGTWPIRTERSCSR